MLRVYLETTVISYLAARRSKVIALAWHQKITHDWWAVRRHDFELFVSELVVMEASRGDVEAAARRIDVLGGLSLLEINNKVYSLAEAFIAEGVVPTTFGDDAFHIAISAVHGVDYLLTWNCKHIANAEMRVKIESVARKNGFICPVICTPEELMGDV
ncbi:MAG: type II toxin-antitoxin system VapC family toxin [Desulfuromonadales bacterium]